MNRSSNGFLPVVYSFMPTIYMLSVIKCKHATMNQSSNGFVPLIYNFCVCRVPYTMLCNEDVMLRHEVRRYAMKMQADVCQTTVKRIYGYVGLEPTYGGDLCSSIENEQKITVPFPTTPTVTDPYMPTALESLQLSESNVGPDFGFCNVSTKLNLRDLILLDNQSTVEIFCNKRLLRNIHISDEDVTVHGNGGALTTNKKGTLKNYGEVWYHEDAITNILSLKNVRSKFQITYVSHPESIFTVHKPDGYINELKMHSDGLHYYDTKSRISAFVR